MTAPRMPPRLPAFAPFQWLMVAVQLIARRPGGLLLAAFALVCGFGALLLLASTLVGLGMRGGASTAPAPVPADFGVVLLPLAMLALAIPQWICGGLSILMHALSQGREVGLSVALAGMRRHWAALTTLVLLPVALMAASLALYRVFGGPDFFAQNMAAMTQAMQSGQAPVLPEPSHPALLNLSLMAVNWLFSVLLLLTPVHVTVGGHGAITAVLAVLHTLSRQLPAMLVGGAVGFALTMAAAMLSLVVLTVVAVLNAALPALALPLSLVMLAVLGACWSVGWSAVAYVAWRALLGGQGPAPTAAGGEAKAQGRIEV